jgi:RNA polymerase sigma factor (sigma-70 family)
MTPTVFGGMALRGGGLSPGRRIADRRASSIACVTQLTIRSLDYWGAEAQTVAVGPIATVPGIRRRIARKPARDETDDLLVARVRDGDAGAFEAIYDRYARGVLAFCVHMLGSREAGEDALQTTFASAYGALRTGGNSVSLRPWLYTIARNRCLSDLRCRPGAELGELAIEHPAFDDVADQVHRREELREILADLQQLPSDQRAALVLLELGDHSHKDIAVILGVRCEKVKALVFQAREGLARGRRARDYPCTDVHEQLATLAGTVPSRSMLRAHIDRCVSCAAFELEVLRQRSALALILPVALSGELKNAVLGAALGGGGAIAACAGTSGGGAMLAGAGAAAGAGATAAGVTAVGADGAAVGLGSLGAGGIAAKVLTAAAIATGAAGVSDVTSHAPSTPVPRLARFHTAHAPRSSTAPTIVSMRRASTTPVSWSRAGGSSSASSVDGRQVGAPGAAPRPATAKVPADPTGSPSRSASGGPPSPAGTTAPPPQGAGSGDGGVASPATSATGAGEPVAIASPTTSTTPTASAPPPAPASAVESTGTAQGGSGDTSTAQAPADTTASPVSTAPSDPASPADPSPASTSAAPAAPTVSTATSTGTATTPSDTPAGDSATTTYG